MAIQNGLALHGRGGVHGAAVVTRVPCLYIDNIRAHKVVWSYFRVHPENQIQTLSLEFSLEF